MSDRAYAKVQAQQKTLIGLPPKSSFLQRSCACGGSPGIDGLCAKSREKRLTAQSSRGGLEAPSVLAAAQDNPSAQEKVSSLHSVADRTSRFGHDFSQIPVYSSRPPVLQTKLHVNQPGDVYEKEADQVAGQAMHMADSELTVPDDEDKTENSLMRKQGAEPETNTTAVSPEAPPVVHSVLSSRRGQPLDAATRAFMEPRFGYDFSQVRVHTDERAAGSAQAVNALAYTVGRDVVFGPGQYVPQSRAGRSLIAHELSHVVQQQNTPSVLQGKLRIGSTSDSAELAADAAARAVTLPENSPYRSSALQIRHQLRSSSLPYPTMQRAVKTWGGEYDTDKYEFNTNPGQDGVNIDLRFKPNKYVDAELIGMTQTARSTMKGSPIPFSMYGKDEEKARESRAIPPGETAAGTFIDQISPYRNPLYATGATGAKDTLSTTPTPYPKKWGEHGWHYTDKAGKLHERDALLIDTPWLQSSLKESSQVFETTALAVKGVQEGTFYGSVQWGWEKDAAGKMKKLPLTLVSNDVPSSVFARASELWNKAKTSKGEATIPLPIVEGKYTNTQGVWLVSNPTHYKTTIIGKLEKNTRLEVTDKGTAKPFNKTAEKDKWWRVTIVDGTHIGKVGWVMQADLSDMKTK